jgi:SOS response regulatory protein OraA/RecX
MGSLHDASVSLVVSKLMESGLSGDQIDRAMRNMIGRDWKKIEVTQWFKKFREQGLIIHNNEDIFIYDLEALVKGWHKLHDLCK